MYEPQHDEVCTPAASSGDTLPKQLASRADSCSSTVVIATRSSKLFGDRMLLKCLPAKPISKDVKLDRDVHTIDPQVFSDLLVTLSRSGIVALASQAPCAFFICIAQEVWAYLLMTLHRDEGVDQATLRCTQ